MKPERCVALLVLLACGESTPLEPLATERAPSRTQVVTTARVGAAHAEATRPDATMNSGAEPRLGLKSAAAEFLTPCSLVEPPPGLVDLAEQVPELRIVAGYHRADNFTGAPLPGYEAAGAWLRADAAAALAEAASELRRAGYGILVYDAYRPRRASEAMVAWARASGREDLLELGFIAARSAHGGGRAIDIGLFALVDGEAQDMGSSWDHFGSTSMLRAVSGAPLERRMLLRSSMLAAGFEPYAREWWHFTWPLREGERPLSFDRPYACRPRERSPDSAAGERSPDSAAHSGSD